MSELLRIEYPEGPEPFCCLRCGWVLPIHWNGGELAEANCCGLWYWGEHVKTDLVVSDRSPWD